jgi:hypothetical protein
MAGVVVIILAVLNGEKEGEMTMGNMIKIGVRQEISEHNHLQMILLIHQGSEEQIPDTWSILKNVCKMTANQIVLVTETDL